MSAPDKNLIERVTTMVESLKRDSDSIMSFDAIKRLKFYRTPRSDNGMWGDANGVEAKTVRLLICLRKSLNSPLGDLENAPAQDVSTPHTRFIGSATYYIQRYPPPGLQKRR